MNIMVFRILPIPRVVLCYVAYSVMLGGRMGKCTDSDKEKQLCQNTHYGWRLDVRILHVPQGPYPPLL